MEHFTYVTVVEIQEKCLIAAFREAPATFSLHAINEPFSTARSADYLVEIRPHGYTLKPSFTVIIQWMDVQCNLKFWALWLS